MDRRAYRVGGRAALARAFFNVLQPLYLVLMSTFVFKTLYLAGVALAATQQKGFGYNVT